MQRIGRVIHVTTSRKAVVKAEAVPKIGDRVVDEKSNIVGKVFDIFGSTSSPYLEVAPDLIDPYSLVNRLLYALPSSRTKGKVKRGKADE